jgi:hypothetical protein
MARKIAAKPRVSRSRKATEEVALEPMAPVLPKLEEKQGGMGKKAVLFIGLVFLVAMGLQAYFVMKSNIKRFIDLDFVNQVVRMGVNESGAVWSVQSLTTDRQGNLVCLGESGSGFQIMTPDGKVLAYYQMPKDGKGPEGKMDAATDLAVDSKGFVYVLMKEPSEVKVFDSKLKFVRKIALTAKVASGIAINSKDQIVVVDINGAKLFIYDAQGKELVKTDGGKFKLAFPHRVALNAKDEIFVLDVARGFEKPVDIKVYSADGSPLRKWTVKSFNSNVKAGISWHPKGYVLLNENSNGSQGYGFYIFNETGKFIGNSIGTTNKMNLAHLFPATIDPRSGDIYAQNQWQQRGVDRFRWDPSKSAEK